MKKITAIFVIICCFAFVSNGNAQQKFGRVIYIDSAYGKSSVLEMYFNEKEYSYRRINKISDTALSFESFKKIDDKIENDESIVGMGKMDALNKTMPPAQTYGNLENGRTILSTYLGLKRGYCQKDTISNFVNWALQPGSDTIFGLLCNRATGNLSSGARFEAWYTNSIPVSVAPYQLRGLPGLIVKIKSINTGNTITLIDLVWPLKREVVLDYSQNKQLLSISEIKADEAKRKEKLKSFVDAFNRGEKVNIKDLNAQ